MAFYFRLDPVLRHRRRVEDAATLGLARTRQRLDAVKARLAALSTEAAAWTQALVATAGRGSTGHELSRLARAVQGLHGQSALGTAELAAQRERVDHARAELVKAARSHRILLRLEESARAAHARRIETLEQRQTDEMASSGYLWQRAQAGPNAEAAR
jgi:flagellar export protein FliJ